MSPSAAALPSEPPAEHAEAVAPGKPNIPAILQGIARSFRGNVCSDLHRYPYQEGLMYEDVSFVTADGVEIKGWFMPRKGATNVVIANHPRWFNRAGLRAMPGDKAIVRGNDWEVNFVRDYKILHDAKYAVLAYDIRNHGESGVTNIYSSGIYEAQDVVASVNYIRNRPDTSGMPITLMSRCNGANSTLHAMRQYPEAFQDIRALVLIQPLSARVFMEKAFKAQNIPLENLEVLDEMIYKSISLHISDFSPVRSTPFVKVPTFICQVHDDYTVEPSDVQAMFDTLPDNISKTLHWIRGTDKRWDGYTWFQDHPAMLLAWLKALNA